MGFVSGPAGEKFSVNVERSDMVSDLRSLVEEEVDFSVDRLMFNTAALDESLTLEQAGLVTESSINIMVALDGGKRKRKKKVYTKPKKIAHKHKKLKNECDKCEVATYMADHPDRYTCGKCGHMLYRLTAKGERLPIPAQNKQAAAAAPAAAAKMVVKKKK